MKYVISPPLKPVQDTIYIPSSKSISNRMLIINALSGSKASLHHLSDSDDTRLLQRALSDDSPVRDVGHAGTAMRFLTAYYAVYPGELILTGSERMKQRPIGPLVNALRQLGASIEWMEREGYPPMRITGGLTRGGEIEIEGGISSQFISALMMVAPALEGGMQLTLTGRVVSEAYIHMTLALMQKAGVMAEYDGRVIRIPRKDYHLEAFTVESDWSAASYWYEIVALLQGSKVILPHLYKKSIQGDSGLSGIFSHLGVSTLFKEEGVELQSYPVGDRGPLGIDFLETPDLVQTCVAACCAKGIPFRFTGTSTLLVKETNRIEALKTEMGKLGYILTSGGGGEWIAWDGARSQGVEEPVVLTYHDHRMAMALAPLAITHGQITVDDPGVVTKSYPGYWDDLRKAGFSIQEA
jgi:3-phosphoshikimate 1-carboxyvinyltransferase